MSFGEDSVWSYTRKLDDEFGISGCSVGVPLSDMFDGGRCSALYA